MQNPFLIMPRPASGGSGNALKPSSIIILLVNYPPRGMTIGGWVHPPSLRSQFTSFTTIINPFFQCASFGIVLFLNSLLCFFSVSLQSSLILSLYCYCHPTTPLLMLLVLPLVHSTAFRWFARAMAFVVRRVAGVSPTLLPIRC